MIKKILIILIILISVPSLTYAIFLDAQKSTGNTFSALTLNTELTPSRDPLELIIDDPIYNFFSYIFENIGTTNTSNNLYITNISDTSFASLIHVEVELNETTTIYSGTLNLLNLSDFKDQAIGQVEKLGFVFTMRPDDLADTAEEELTFSLVHHSWQENLSPNTGFYDNEILNIKISNETPIETSFTATILGSVLPERTTIDILDELQN